MKSSRRIWFSLLVLLLALSSMKKAIAQDIHFSQFYASPLNLNPIQTGNFDGDYRFVLNHKTQWASVSLPYNTNSGSFDTRLFGSKAKGGALCAGILFNEDKAGDSKLGLMQATGSLAYMRRLDGGKNFLSLGVQGGYAQRSISYDKLIFNDQYDGDAYNPNLSNGEAFGADNYSFLDISGGGAWHFVAKGFSSNLGFAMFHLNEPVLGSFNGAASEPLSHKTVATADIRFTLFGRTEMIPAFMLSTQRKFHEMLFGSNLRFGFEPKFGFNNAIYLGCYYRNKDAIVCVAGFDIDNLNIGISYDVNSSSLKTASNSRGGLELSLIYIIKKVPTLPGTKKPCPTYL